MKKQITALLACTMLLTSSAGAIFPDIPDATTQQAVTSLHSLGIVSGMGNGLYEPNRTLTRAEFTKMAATSMALPIQTATFSVFADVPYTHWSAPYVNATVGTETPVITGYADGTFRPSATVSYGEACTMLLRMLGYGIEDIGANWPIDYINKAEQLGLNGNQRVAASTPVTRGMAAIFLQNTLSAATKEGTQLLEQLTGASSITDAILVALPQTDASLSLSQASFYVGGEIQTLYTVAGLDTTLIGKQGTVLFDKTDSTLVKGFLPTGGASQTRTIMGVMPEGIMTAEGFLPVPRNTPTLVLGEVLPYAEGWFDLPVGSAVAVQFTSTGDIRMLTATTGGSYLPNTLPQAGALQPWQGGNTLPFDSTLVKNGVSISASAVDKYDVLTQDIASGITLVSSTRISGIYADAKPAFRYPEQITVLGQTWDIPAAVAGQFTGLEEGDSITLLFDVYKRVAGVTTNRSAKQDMIGVVTASGGSDVTVALLNGLVISGDLDLEEDETADITLGEVVEVKQNSDGITLKSGRADTQRPADWQVSQSMMGKYRVSTQVMVFDTAKNNKQLTLLPRSLYPTGTVKSTDISKAYCDENGVIIALVLDNYTGAGWIYGIAEDATNYDLPTNADEQYIPDTRPDALPDALILNPDWIPEYDYQMQFATLDATVTIAVTDEPREGLLGIPVAVYAQPAKRTDLDTQSLYKQDSVSLADFDGYDRVKVDGKWYDLPEDVPVYRKRDGAFMTLRTAKSNYDDFTVYTDSKSGGMVRLLVLA